MIPQKTSLILDIHSIVKVLAKDLPREVAVPLGSLLGSFISEPGNNENDFDIILEQIQSSDMPSLSTYKKHSFKVRNFQNFPFLWIVILKMFTRSY